LRQHFLATDDGTNNSVPDSLQTQVRLKVFYVSGGSQVIRIFPLTFFDNAKP
jgi:hypothetical protein